jgi:hypothetical protein
MGLHIPFEYLKHKLWPKERSRVKLAIWLSKKSGTAMIYLSVGGMPHIIGNSSTRVTILLQISPQSEVYKKIWASKVMEVPILRIFGLPTLGSWDKMTFGCSPVINKKEYYKGEGGGFPQVWVVVNLMTSYVLVICLCTKSAPNILQLCIN